MTSAIALDSRFPNLRPEVVEGYLHAPGGLVAEVLDGELSLMPRPRRQHSRSAITLSGELRGFDRPREGEPGGWVFLFEPVLHLGTKPDIVVPDLCGWRRERLPDDFLSEDAAAEIELAPDWVCEVLSASTEATDRGKKRRIYRREGVSHLWMVSPELRTLEVFRLENGRWSEVDTFEGDAVIRAEPFDAIDLDLSALWPTPKVT